MGAQSVGRSPTQVALRWAIERNITVVPRTNNVTRLEENFNFKDFLLENDDLDKLDALEGELAYWDIHTLATSSPLTATATRESCEAKTEDVSAAAESETPGTPGPI